MRINFTLMATLASMIMAGPVARDQVSDLTTLTTTVKEHTANISTQSIPPIKSPTMCSTVR